MTDLREMIANLPPKFKAGDVVTDDVALELWKLAVRQATRNEDWQTLYDLLAEAGI